MSETTLKTLYRRSYETAKQKTDQTFYASLLCERIAGIETFYRQGIYRITDSLKVYAYQDCNRHKRFTLAYMGQTVTVLKIDQTQTVTRMFTSPEHRGEGYNALLRSLVTNVVQEKLYFLSSELSECGRQSIGL